MIDSVIVMFTFTFGMIISIIYGSLLLSVSTGLTAMSTGLTVHFGMIYF